MGTVKLLNIKGSTKDIIIPNTINGLNVINIGKNAFRNKSLTSVVLPESLHTIGHSAFLY